MVTPTAGPGVLVLAATPIGPPARRGPRLAQEIAAADVVAAEDTRRLRVASSPRRRREATSPYRWQQIGHAHVAPVGLAHASQRAAAETRKHRRNGLYRARPGMNDHDAAVVC